MLCEFPIKTSVFHFIRILQYEDPQIRQMNIIQEVQQSMFKVLQQLDTKMDQLSQSQQSILQTRSGKKPPWVNLLFVKYII